LIKKLVFFSICTWEKLSQDKVLASLGIKRAKPSMLSSISANLDIGRKNGLYTKSDIKPGYKKQAEFSLSTDYRNSNQMKSIRFIPTQQALDIARNRARKKT